MTLRFFVRYSTSWGQQLSLAIDSGSVLPMTWYDHDHWTATLEWDLPELRYHYILTHGWEVKEQSVRCIVFHKDEQELTIRDEWRQPGRVADCFMKAPFRDVYFHHPASPVPRGASHYFQVSAPLLESGRELWLTGNTDTLGNWNAASAVKMQAREDGRFAANVNIPPGVSLEYKYLLDGVEYEAGENRSFLSAGPCVADDGYARFNHPLWKGAGVAVPEFSLRSGKGLGCGEFSDLRLLADWAASTGQRMIQLLPVNDTIAEHSWKDSYPYAAISAFALHPMYIHLPALGVAEGYAAMQRSMPCPIWITWQRSHSRRRRCKPSIRTFSRMMHINYGCVKINTGLNLTLLSAAGAMGVRMRAFIISCNTICISSSAKLWHMRTAKGSP